MCMVGVFFLPGLECWGLQQQPQTNTSWLLFEQQLHFHQVHAESRREQKQRFNCFGNVPNNN